MLMSHGKFVLPENVPANEFLNLEGNKLSTSRNYAVWLDDYLEKFEADSLRYVLTISMPETRDSDFSWKEFQARHNNELADVLGNFINRTLTFIKRYFGGKIPNLGELDELDKSLLQRAVEARDSIGEAIDNFQFKESLKRFMDFARFANKYFNDKEPWLTRKSAPEVCATTLNLCAQTGYFLAILMNPVLPFTSQKIWKMLQLSERPEDSYWNKIGDIFLKKDHALANLEILFQKIEDSTIQKEVEKLNKIQTVIGKDLSVLEENQISIEEFKKVQLKTARVLAAEAIPKAKKLLKLKVEIGSEKRQLVAGIAEHYEPAELVGKTIVVVTNLQPVTIRGVESQGMLLAVQDDGKLSLITTDRESNSGKSIS